MGSSWNRCGRFALASALLAGSGCKELNPEFQAGEATADATSDPSLSASDDDDATGVPGTTAPGDESSSVGATSESTADAESTSDAATSADASSSTGDVPPPPECSMDAVPEGGACPPECTGGCVDDVCTIDCTTDGCASAMVACPAEFACAVLCEVGSACEGAAIACPPDYACSVTCDGNSACRNLDLVCAAGTCALSCLNGPNVCRDVNLLCGSKNSTATCTGGGDISLTPLAESLCLCEGC